jgi:hypothetical protein
MPLPRNLTSKMNSPPTPPAKVPDRLLFWSTALFIGLLQTWAHRHDFAPDSISYVEIAWATVRFGLAHLVSGYWSPLYPFLLSLEFRFFHPSPQMEFAAVHLLNFVLFIVTITGFELFLRELILARRGASSMPAESVASSQRTLWLWGGVLFVWSTQFWLGPSLITPDLCVATLAFLATALLLRIRRGFASWPVFLVFGALLGLSYLAKTAMFFVAFVFLVSAFFLGRKSGLSLRAAALRSLLAAAVFACFALPFVHALSVQKGRLTIGDAGRINFAEYVNRATLWVHWQGEPSGTGSPSHATRKVFSDPVIYEFASPVSGAYPPWYDPSYWYEGIHPSLSLRNQLWAMFRATNAYLRFFSKSGALWLVIVTLWFFWKKEFFWARLAPGTWLVLLPSAAALAMYELVHVEFRLVAPFALLLLLGALAKVWFKLAADPWNARRLAVIIALAPVLAIVWSVARDVTLLVRNAPDEQWEVAQQLHDFGILQGTQIATFGTGSGAAWAHLAGVRIIAEIPDKELPRFIAANAGRKLRIFGLLSSLGAATIVTWNPAVANSSEGWRAIPRTHYFVWLPADRKETGAPSPSSIP